MFVLLIFMFNDIFSDHVFSNLGLIAIENQTLYSYSGYGYAQSNLELRFRNSEYFHNSFLSRCENFTSKAAKFSSVKNPNKLLQSKVLTILAQYGIFEKYQGEDLRSKRQAVAIGLGLAGGFELLKTMFSDSSKPRLVKLERTISAVAKAQHDLTDSLKKKIDILACENQYETELSHAEILNVQLEQEILSLQSILASIIFRVGVNAQVNYLFINACISITDLPIKICRDIIKNQLFTTEIIEISEIDPTFENVGVIIKFKSFFPLKLELSYFREIHNFGVLLTKNKGRKISSLESLNAIQGETDIGFSLQKCKIVGSVFICPTNIFFEKNLAANACLKDIFLKNQTSSCEFVDFYFDRSCSIFTLNKHYFINSAIQFEILQTGNYPTKIYKKTGKPGLHRLPLLTENIVSTTVICGDYNLAVDAIFPVQNITVFENPSIFTKIQNFSFDWSQNQADYELKSKKFEKIMADFNDQSKTFFANWGHVILTIFCIIIFLIVLVIMINKLRNCTNNLDAQMI
jgi:hypothetical protein